MYIQRDTKLMWLSVFLSTALGYLLSNWGSFVLSLETYIPYKWLLMLSIVMLSALALGVPWLFYLRKMAGGTIRPIVLDRGDPVLSVLSLIAKYHSQENPATPKRIAEDLGLDRGITLAHMVKYNNDQLITFRNNGKPPELNTAFFLSPKAWELIKIVKA